jgi:thiol-disulfide isomerase/thioredoxin
MKPLPLLLLLALVTATLPQALQAQGKAPTADELAQAAGAPLIGKYAPPITLTTIDGKKIELAKLYGRKPVYLKFWATWCVPCRLQMPHFENVERTMGGDMQVVAVDAGFNETRDAVVRYRETMGLTMPVVIDDGRLADALHLRVTPQHIVIGRDGRILHVGQLADARLDHALQQAMAEPPAAYAKTDARRELKQALAQVPALKTLGGETLSLHEGARPTVVFFFSPWCESYLKSSRPAMAEACRQAREQVTLASRKPGARWVGIAAGLWSTEKDLADYQREHALQMPMALDETGAVFHAFKIADVPTFLVLDRSGRIAERTRSAEQASRAAARLAAGKAPAQEL